MSFDEMDYRLESRKLTFSGRGGQWNGFRKKMRAKLDGHGILNCLDTDYGPNGDAVPFTVDEQEKLAVLRKAVREERREDINSRLHHASMDAVQEARTRAAAAAAQGAAGDEAAALPAGGGDAAEGGGVAEPQPISQERLDNIATRAQNLELVAIDEEVRREAERRLYKMRVANNRKVYNYLIEACEGPAMNSLAGVPEGDGFAAWRALKQTFQVPSELRTTVLHHGLFNRRLGNGENPEAYFAVIAETLMELREAGMEVDEENLKHTMIYNMGSKYNVVRDQLLYSYAPYTINDLKEKIRACHLASQLQRGHQGRPGDAFGLFPQQERQLDSFHRSQGGGKQGSRRHRHRQGDRDGRGGSAGRQRHQQRGSRGDHQQREGGQQSPPERSLFGGGAAGGRGGRQETRRCYNCNQLGHLSKDCKAPRQARAGMALRQQEERTTSHRVFMTLPGKASYSITGER